MTDEPLYIATAAASLDDHYAAPSQHLHGDGETEMEHIARDIREGRFPERSERRTSTTEAQDIGSPPPPLGGCGGYPVRNPLPPQENFNINIKLRNFLARLPE